MGLFNIFSKNKPLVEDKVIKKDFYDGKVIFSWNSGKYVRITNDCTRDWEKDILFSNIGEEILSVNELSAQRIKKIFESANDKISRLYHDNLRKSGEYDTTDSTQRLEETLGITLTKIITYYAIRENISFDPAKDIILKII